MPQSPKINLRLIFIRDVNLTTTKTVIDAISSKSGDFNKMAEKKILIKAFLPSLDNFKIFAKDCHKHHGEITEPV